MTKKASSSENLSKNYKAVKTLFEKIDDILHDELLTQDFNSFTEEDVQKTLSLMLIYQMNMTKLYCHLYTVMGVAGRIQEVTNMKMPKGAVEKENKNVKQ